MSRVRSFHSVAASSARWRAPTLLLATALSSACTVDANANPAARCADDLGCPAALACYRGYCVAAPDDSGIDAVDDSGAQAAAPVRDASGLSGGPAPVPAPQAATPPPAQPTQPPQAQPTPQPVQPPQAQPSPPPTPPPTTWPDPVEDLCRFLCERLGDCSCLEELPVPCSNARTRCGDKCVHLQSDRKHCGSCSHECARGGCERGECDREEVDDDD